MEIQKKEQISIHCSVNLFINFTEKPKANPQPPFCSETFQSTAIGAASRLPASAIGVGIFLRLDSQSNNSPICPSLRDWVITLFRVILPWVVGWRFGICRWKWSNMCFFQRNDLKKHTQKNAKSVSMNLSFWKKKLMSRFWENHWHQCCSQMHQQNT